MMFVTALDDGGYFLRAERKTHRVRRHRAERGFVLAMLLSFMLAGCESVAQHLGELIAKLCIHGSSLSAHASGQCFHITDAAWPPQLNTAGKQVRHERTVGFLRKYLSCQL